MAISISKFASDPNLLNLELWPKQAEILEEFWQGNYSIAIWALGRRSGKTLMSAVVATYAACMLSDEYKKHLRSGERFYVVSVANTIDQARISLQGVKDLINGSPILKPLIIRETSDTLELSNGCVFKALPTSSRSGRGMACALLVFDEISHAVDTETGNAAGGSLFQALSPSVAQFSPLGKILMLSSPWIKQGIFWELFQQGNSGKFPHIQVVQAPTWQINPRISKDFLEQEKARDPVLFRVEYGAEFTGNFAAFLEGYLIDNAINYDRGPLPPIPEARGRYYLSLDPAKSRDNYTATIAHYEGERLIVDLFHQFSPSWSDGKKLQVNIAEVEQWVLEKDTSYGFAQVTLDQFNSASTIQRLSGQVKIRELTWTASSKTEAYSKLRELFNSQNIELYMHAKAIQQLKNLMVRYRPNGTWDVSGGAGTAVDDYPASLAGAVLAAQSSQPWEWLSCYSIR